MTTAPAPAGSATGVGAAHSRSRPRPVDIVLSVYLAVAGAALFFPHRAPGWPALAAFHVGLILLALRPGVIGRWLGAVARRLPRISTIVADWYPLALVPALYTELATLNVAVWNGRYFDGVILSIEQSLFGGQPSHELAAALPLLPLSEVLHAAYLSYYVIIYGPPLILYLMRRREAFHASVFTLMLAFAAHYVFFIYFPVQGPRYLFPAPGGRIAKGTFYKLAHRVLQSGSSRGAAFPSSHVGVSVAQCVVVARYLPYLAPVVVLLTIGLAFGAIYGGFHYATDAIAGLILGLVVALLAPRLRRRLAGLPEAPEEAAP